MSFFFKFFFLIFYLPPLLPSFFIFLVFFLSIHFGMSKLYLGKSGASNFLKLVSLACKSTVDIVDSVSSIPECDQSKVSENVLSYSPLINRGCLY